VFSIHEKRYKVTLKCHVANIMDFAVSLETIHFEGFFICFKKAGKELCNEGCIVALHFHHQ
jgi:hypothetical protein